jgi:hypothetical protein
MVDISVRTVRRRRIDSHSVEHIELHAAMVPESSFDFEPVLGFDGIKCVFQQA